MIKFCKRMNRMQFRVMIRSIGCLTLIAATGRRNTNRNIKIITNKLLYEVEKANNNSKLNQVT